MNTECLIRFQWAKWDQEFDADNSVLYIFQND